MLMELNLERGTWQLLHVLYRDRVESEEQGEGMMGDEEVMPVCDVLLSAYPSPSLPPSLPPLDGISEREGDS